MPGTIRVSVLEAVELPKVLTDGTVNDVIAKVRLGRRQFETESRVAVEGRIDSWNSAFVFLITNLRDKLVVTICDNADQCLTQTSIEVPSIIEKGCRDEFVELKGGGRIHLIMSFVLTDQERRKIESMRLRVLKRREEERVKRTIVFQNVQPSGKELKAATMHAVTITEVDDDPTHGNKDSRESASGPAGFGSITKPTLMFDYAKAVGLQSRKACQRAEKRSKIWAADVVSNEVKAGINSFKYDEQVLRQFAQKELGFGSHENAMINSSAMSSRSLQRAASSLTSSVDIASTLIVSPSGQDPSPGKVTLGDVKIQAEVLYTSLSKGRDEPGIPASDIEEDKWGIEDQRTCCVLEAEAPIMANSFNDRSTLVGEHMKNSGFHRGATHFAQEGQTLIWSRHQAVQARSSLKDIPKFEGPSGQGQRLEARPGPGSRWAQKTGLETRWTSSEKARQIARCAWNGPISDPFKDTKIPKTMRESIATLVTQTTTGVTDAIVANISDNVKHALELEQRDPEVQSPKEAGTRDAPSWGYQLCPHTSSSRGCGVANSRMHLFAVVGVLVTGAFVLYTTALHMGFLGSEEVAAALFSTLPSDNFTTGSAPAPPNRVPDSSAAANSSVGANTSVGDYSSEFANTSPAANSSEITNSSAVSNSSVVANSSALANTSPVANLSVVAIPSADANSSVSANSSVVSNPSEVAYSPPLDSPTIPIDELSPLADIDGIPGSIPNPAQVYFQNMSETWHSMSDTKLLQKATSGRRDSSVSGPSKLAFLFLVRGTLPFAPLWERFFRGQGEFLRVYIHAHPDYVPDLAPTSPFFGRFVPSKIVQWGRLSVFEAERRLLGNALLEPSNSWFLLLSESCIPLFSFPETYAYFNNSPGENFIESYEDSTRSGQGRLYRGRYEAMAPEITSSNFRKGSQWFQITRDLALMAARDSPEYTKFKKYFCAVHSVCYIDEHFLPTLAWIEFPKTLAFRTLTYFAFRGHSPHPNKFTKKDTTRRLMRWLREGHNCTYNGQVTSKCHLFARKFDKDALGVLLDLADPVMGIP